MFYQITTVVLTTMDWGWVCKCYYFRWFFGQISRRDAEEFLMTHTNARGTFLIRESEQNPGGYALSIKDWDQERSYHVKHYKIKPLDNNRGYFITTRQTFNSLLELVEGYQSTSCKGLCCQLTKPCPKPHGDVAHPFPAHPDAMP